MIKVKLQDRMGNQMFQYAYAYAASKRLGTTFSLDTLSHGNHLKQYFKLSPWWNNLSQRFYKRIDFQEIKQTGHDNPSEVLQRETDRHYYEGYFQSPILFQEFRKELLNQYQIKRKYIEKFRSKYGLLFNQYKTLILHVRRTDYLQHGSDHTGGADITLPIEYYNNCLSQSDYSKHKIFVIGDDHKFMENIFSHLPNVVIAKNSEIIDFQLLLNADVVITANSSFSWWGAWLNNKPEKVIYAPRYWFGHKARKEYPVGIIPEGWIQVQI